MTILALDSTSDSLTRRASEYREANVYPHFTALGHAVTRFTAIPPPSLRPLVKAEATKAGLKYLTGVGHGDSNIAFTGNSMDEIFGVGGYDPEEVRGKIVHFLSCGIGDTLGRDLVKNGCTAFFGYKENFALLDDVADIFFECDSEIDRAFAEGEDAQAVFDRVIGVFDRHIRELRAQKKNYQASWLRFNRRSLCAPSKDVAWGDPQAKLV
jgi:hypothetical protein